MRVSLNLVKKYVDLPKDLSYRDIAYDLTLRTVEVEDVINTSEKFNNMVVGKIISVDSHPDADKLRVCLVDVGEEENLQIVCGGSNLYEGEMVVVSKVGAYVYWHGNDELVKIEKSKVRGVLSYGMICAAEEVYLEDLFPPKSETEIVDLAGFDCYPGEEISKLIGMDDVILEIDNKSLTNRPDLWGHYGIARELSAIYKTPLKELDKFVIPEVPGFKVTIKEPDKCNRYVGVIIDNVDTKESPLWMKTTLINCGMRPINAIVNITNYVMLAVGQPTHAFDKTHVKGNEIIVRNANEGEELELLDGNKISLTNSDLVICDNENAMALAGIRGGIKDSILEDTTGVLLEVANFSAQTIRKSGKRFAEKTEASMRYEKGLDTCRVDEGVNLALNLFKELFPECKITAYTDEYPVKTERISIDVSQEFLDVRLGKELSKDNILSVLEPLGYDVKYENGIYHVVTPVWRSTGDVSLKDDVLGDIARLLSFSSFEAKPLPVKFTNAVIQNDVLLERRIREYLANRCGFYEIFTYPWIDEKYIEASRIDTSKSCRLATPPAPELTILRSSLIPGMLEAISKNLRYFDEFKMFEMTEVYEQGDYHESSLDESLPVQKKYLTGSITGKNAKEIFYEMKGVIENISRYTHMEDINLVLGEKPCYADPNAYLDIVVNNKKIGTMGLVSTSVMMDAKIKRTNVCLFELDVTELIPFASRTNKFEHLPLLPLVEKDLSILVDEEISWEKISSAIKGKVKEVIFVEEYRGDKIPQGKKSITLKIKLENTDVTMTSEEINNKMDKLLRTLEMTCGAVLRTE